MNSQTNGRRVAIYGGAFDPLHNGHVAVIRHLLDIGEFDFVLVVPSGDRPDKPNVSSGAHRYQMALIGVTEIFRGDSRVGVSDVQSSGVVGYSTLDLVLYLRRDPSLDLHFVIGHELLPDLPQWFEAERLRRSVKFSVIDRPGAAQSVAPDGWQVNFLPPLANSGLDISSTDLRQKLYAGQACDGLLPTSVLSYCHHHRLFPPTGTL